MVTLSFMVGITGEEDEKLKNGREGRFLLWCLWDAFAVLFVAPRESLFIIIAKFHENAQVNKGGKEPMQNETKKDGAVDA